MEPYRYIGSQEIRGQQWMALKWNYFIPQEIFRALNHELMREIPDEHAYSTQTKTLYVKQAAIADFEEIVEKHLPMPPSLNELDEAFRGAGQRKGFEQEDGYDSRGMKPLDLDPNRPLTNYLDDPKSVLSASEPLLVCGDCGKECKNDRGLAIHRGKAH